MRKARESIGCPGGRARAARRAGRKSHARPHYRESCGLRRERRLRRGRRASAPSTVTYLDEPAGQVTVAHLCQPRFEPEIVLHFARAPGRAADETELLASVDWVAHGFEIVQTHFPGWRFQLADTIADFGLHGALVVGPRRYVADLGNVREALRACSITLTGERDVQLHGVGANALGSPLLATLHLLEILSDRPDSQPVQAGEIVTTGTLVPPPSIAAGETWRTALTGIALPGLQLRID